MVACLPSAPTSTRRTGRLESRVRPDGPTAATIPGGATLGYFTVVAGRSKAVARPLPLRRSGPSCDVESANRGVPCTTSSSPAPPRAEAARTGECVCGVPCTLWVSRDQAAQRNAAVDGTVLIAQEEAAQWEHGMAIHTLAVVVI